MDGRRLRAVVFSVVGTIGVAASVLAVDRPEGASGWVLLAVGSVAAGVLCGLAAAGSEAPAAREGAGVAAPPGPAITPALRNLMRRLHRYLRGRASRALTVTALLAVVVVTVVAAPTVVARIWPPACPQPVELRVLTTPDQLNALQPVARAFERATVDRRGCPAANLYVYALPIGEAVPAISEGWPEWRLGQGPRPDVWLINSPLAAQQVIDRVGARSDPMVTMGSLAQVAMSPLVIGYPTPGTPAWAANPSGWSEALSGALADNWGFVRADPEAFPSGLYARAAVLQSISGARVRVSIDLWERSIVQTMGDGAYRVDDEAGDDVLLRQYEQQSGQDTELTAVIVTEQALARHNQRRAGDCRSDPVLRAYYPTDTTYVVLEFAQFRWGDSAGSPQETVAAQFRDWLLNDVSGQQAVAEAGLRPVNNQLGGLITAGCGVDPAGPSRASRGVLSHQLLHRAATHEAPVRGRLLFLLDTSGSMKETVDTDGERIDRLTLAGNAVTGALANMTGQDEFGLWEFPGEKGAVAEVVRWQPAPDPGGDSNYLDDLKSLTRRALSELAADGLTTPLFEAILAGIQGVAPEDDGAQDIVRALVVISDGKDTAGGPSPQQLINAAKEREVRVFVLAVGELSCAASHLEEIAEQTGGVCRETTPATLGSALDRLVGGVWGGPDGT